MTNRVRTTDLPTTAAVVELIGHADAGGGTLVTRRIPINDIRTVLGLSAGPVLYPEDFGAAGYPTIAEAQAGTDQGVKLQAWLDAGAAQGAACALGNGTYYLSQRQLTIHPGQVMLGSTTNGIVWSGLATGDSGLRGDGTEGSAITLLADALAGMLTADVGTSATAGLAPDDLIYFRSTNYWCPFGADVGQAVTDGEFAWITDVDVAATYLDAIAQLQTTLTAPVTAGDTTLHVTDASNIVDGQNVFVATPTDATAFDQTTVVSHTGSTIVVPSGAITRAYAVDDCTVEWPAKAITVKHLLPQHVPGAIVRIVDRTEGIDEHATVASVAGHVLTLTAPLSTMYYPRYRVLVAAPGWIALSRPLFRAYLTTKAGNVRKRAPLDGVRARGLRLVGPGVNVGNNGIWIELGRDCVIEDCAVKDFGRAAVVLSRCLDATVRGGRLDNAQEPGFSYGVDAGNGCEQLLVDGVVSRRTRDSVATGGTDGVMRKLRVVNVVGAGQGGLDSHPGIDDITYLQCIQEGWETGGGFDAGYCHAAHAVFDTCLIRSPNRHGISWEPLGDGVREVSIRVVNNTIESLDGDYEGIVCINDVPGQVMTAMITGNRIEGFNRQIHLECTAGEIRLPIIKGNQLGVIKPVAGAPGAGILIETEGDGEIKGAIVSDNAVALTPDAYGVEIYAGAGAGSIDGVEVSGLATTGGDATSVAVYAFQANRVRTRAISYAAPVLGPTFDTCTSSFDVDAQGSPAPAFSVHLASSQTLGSGTAATLAFDTVDDDSNSWWNASTHAWVPQVPGRYQIFYTAEFVGTWTAGSAQMQAQILKNATAVDTAQGSAEVSATSKQTVASGAMVALNGTTDAISVLVKASGATLSVQGSTGHETKFWAYRIGP